MFYPLTVTVERPEGMLSGCGGEPASLLLGPEWVVESIDGDTLIGNSRPTIAFNEEGQVAGLRVVQQIYSPATSSPGKGCRSPAAHRP